jgi:hypothetical protein
MTPPGLRRSLGFIALLAAIFAYVKMQLVGDWYAEPFRVTYSGQSISNLPVQIEKDGSYLVQLEVSRKAKGEDIRQPKATPLDAVVSSNGKEIGSTTESGWYARDVVSFSFYRFPAKKGQLVHLSVNPTSTLNRYKSHVMHLVVARDDWDYGIYMWRQFGWFLLTGLSLLIAVCLFSHDIRAGYRTLISR